MTKQTTPNPTKKPRKPRTQEVFDQDFAWKDFITNNFFDFLKAVVPQLYADVDKSQPLVFLEQEFHNSLRGKYKVKGKEKRVDKLIKLRLLTKEDCYIYSHSEIQGDLQDIIPERVYEYRNFISLKYQTQNITNIVIFTGKSPLEKHKMFTIQNYGTIVFFQFNCLVIADLNIETLEKSDNIFDLALLAAKYTLDTEGDNISRYSFKQKVFELAQKKQIPLEKIDELLSFVLDYMLLPEELDKKFMFSTPYYQPINNNDTMVATKGRKMLVDMGAIALYGKPVEELLDDKDAEKKAEMEAERSHTIISLLKNNFSALKIAEMLGYNLKFVQKIAREFEKEQLAKKA